MLTLMQSLSDLDVVYASFVTTNTTNTDAIHTEGVSSDWGTCTTIFISSSKVFVGRIAAKNKRQIRVSL